VPRQNTVRCCRENQIGSLLTNQCYKRMAWNRLLYIISRDAIEVFKAEADFASDCSMSLQSAPFSTLQ
jgi:hypothetical protein